LKKHKYTLVNSYFSTEHKEQRLKRISTCCFFGMGRIRIFITWACALLFLMTELWRNYVLFRSKKTTRDLIVFY